MTVSPLIVVFARQGLIKAKSVLRCGSRRDAVIIAPHHPVVVATTIVGLFPNADANCCSGEQIKIELIEPGCCYLFDDVLK
jgi:hypothetical protein